MINKQYLIPESSLIGKIKTTSTIVSDEMIEVDVLTLSEVAAKIYEDVAIPHAFLSAVIDYLAANNLQIIKTVK